MPNFLDSHQNIFNIIETKEICTEYINYCNKWMLDHNNFRSTLTIQLPIFEFLLSYQCIEIDHFIYYTYLDIFNRPRSIII